MKIDPEYRSTNVRCGSKITKVELSRVLSRKRYVTMEVHYLLLCLFFLLI